MTRTSRHAGGATAFLTERSTAASGRLLRRTLSATGAPTAAATVADSSFDWRTVRGAALVNGTLYYGASDNRVYARPFDPATGTVGMRALPVQGPCWYGDTWDDPRGDGRTHEGVDLITFAGQYVYAVADGTLTSRAWDQPGRISGNAAAIDAAADDGEVEDRGS